MKKTRKAKVSKQSRKPRRLSVQCAALSIKVDRVIVILHAVERLLRKIWQKSLRDEAGSPSPSQPRQPAPPPPAAETQAQ